MVTLVSAGFITFVCVAGDNLGCYLGLQSTSLAAEIVLGLRWISLSAELAQCAVLAQCAATLDFRN